MHFSAKKTGSTIINWGDKVLIIAKGLSQTGLEVSRFIF